MARIAHEFKMADRNGRFISPRQERSRIICHVILSSPFACENSRGDIHAHCT